MNPGVVDLETIYAAFFALVSGNNLPSWQCGDTQMAFAAATRMPRDPATIDAGYLPLLMQEELPFDLKAKISGQACTNVYELRVDLGIVVPSNGPQEEIGKETIIPSAVLNGAITAVLNAIFPKMSSLQQTLGGLVRHVNVSGRIERVHALPSAGSHISVGVIPFTITTV